MGADGLDVHQYGSSLSTLARVLPGVEQTLARRRCDRLSFVPLTPLLLDDVRSLGLDVGETKDAPESIVDDDGSWWGAMYVLQGSRLGARVIADRLATDLPDVPRSYFDAAATGAAPAWAAFRAAARSAFEGGHADLDRAIVSARAVFAALLVEFERTDDRASGRGRVA